MKQSRSLAPFEIRVIKIGREAIMDLTWEILSEICHEKFRIPRSMNSVKRIRIDRHFDSEKGEIILFAHSSMYELNMEAAVAHVNKLSVEATESLLLNPDGKDYYSSILDASFEISHPNVNAAKTRGSRLDNALEKIHTMLNHRVRVMDAHEIRVIWLSQQAIQELVWEYFVKNGDKIMEIPKKDSFSVIFHMNMEEKLEKLTLYAINLNEASDSVFEEAEAYCSEKIGFTTDSLLKESGEEHYYVSVTLPKL